MRRVGLILMVGLLLAAGGVGLGWLAAGLQLDGEIAADSSVGGAIGAELPLAVDLAADPAADAVADPGERSADAPDATPLQAAAERTGALEGEIARLRWQLASRRRTCLPQTAEPAPGTGPAAIGPETVAALDGPHSLIHNPEPPPELEPAPAPHPAVEAPAFAPERERVPAPVVAAADPAPALPAIPPPSAPAPAPQPSYRPGQDLTVPEAAVRSGDVGFLDGCWVSSPFSNPVNGVASTKVYCFDGNGNGRMSFRGSDGVTCEAPIRARWEPGRRLVLEEPQDGSCSNFGPWYREQTSCSIGGDGRAQCNSYEFFRQFNYGTRLTRN